MRRESRRSPVGAIPTRRRVGTAFTAKKTSDPAVTETRTFLHQLTHPLCQSRLIVPRTRLVTLSAAWLIQHATGTTFRNAELRLKLIHGRTLAGRAYQFPSETCFSIRLLGAGHDHEALRSRSLLAGQGPASDAGIHPENVSSPGLAPCAFDTTTGGAVLGHGW